jgi:hypothetical protein
LILSCSYDMHDSIGDGFYFLGIAMMFFVQR